VVHGREDSSSEWITDTTG